MKRYGISALVLLSASLGVSGVLAAAAGGGAASFGIRSNQPIAVNADNFLADLNGETGTYTGNVIVTQGEVKLHADRVTVVAPGGRAARMEAEGHVVVDSPSGQAVGDNGIYDVAAQSLRLTGHVVLTKDANVMRGNTLEVAMDTGLARLTGGAESVPEGQPRGRVQGLFLPAQRPGAPQEPSQTPAQ